MACLISPMLGIAATEDMDVRTREKTSMRDPSTALSGKKILIVEDDQDAALAVGVMLRRRGFDVTSAADAITAVAMARRESPDLIILDMGLPAGGGDAVLERLRSLVQTAITPVIVLTGLDISREHVIEAGAQDLLRKPVDATHLLGAVTRVLTNGQKEA